MRYFRLLGVFILSFIASYAVFADPPKKSAATPLVIITKTDNSTIRGKLLAADAAGITVEVTSTPAPKEPVQLAWTDIAKYNGLPPQKAFDKWKIDHKDQLCPTCHGNGTTTCPTCKGTGKDLQARADCPLCHGAGTVKCTAPHCTNGQVPCPGPCLKLSVGNWTKHSDGLRWRRFTTSDGGYFEWSEHHLGSVVEMKNGAPTGQLLPCPICGGTATVACSVCEGAGLVPCTDCRKSNAPACPDHCDGGKIKCKDCTGTGLKP